MRWADYVPLVFVLGTALLLSSCAGRKDPVSRRSLVDGRCGVEAGVCVSGVPVGLEPADDPSGWRCLGRNGGAAAECTVVRAPAAGDEETTAKPVATSGGVAPLPLLQPPPRGLAPAASTAIAELLAAKAQRTAAQRKLSSDLLDILKATLPRLENGAGLPKADGVFAVSEAMDGVVLVDIRADVTPAVLERIRELGGAIVNSVPGLSAIRAQLPLSVLEPLAELDAVRSIRTADEATTQGETTRSSSVAASDASASSANTSEGDVAHRADEARRTHGVDGTGLGIGVLSNGVDSLATRQASGDLPSRVSVLSGQAGRGDEGTAMLEIVHDLAPGAKLYFATAFDGQPQFATNIEALCAAGADVIVDDVYYYQEPAFQDGAIAEAISTAVEDGCFYFTAGGNDGNLSDGTSGTWEGDFVAGDDLMVDGLPTGTVHDFGGGVTANTLTELGDGFVLQWADAWGASSNDYDLFLLDESGEKVLASSTNVQDGTQSPVEWIPDHSSLVGALLVVVKATDAAGRYLRVSTGQGKLGVATAGATSGHYAAESSVTVAAVDVRDAGGGAFDGTESVETFSSDGPRRMFFEPDGTPITADDFSSTGGEVLLKPDLAAANCVSTATPGFSPFCGTSAAAPHAAAIAALLLQAAGGPARLSLAEVRAALTNNALDIEADGRDRDSGEGIVVATEAVDAVDVPVATRNQAPAAADVLVDRTLALGGDSLTIDLASAFTDSNNDALTYTVGSSNSDRVAASVTSASLTLTAIVPSRVAVTVRATDPGGLKAEQAFLVTAAVGDQDFDLDDDGLIEVGSLAQLDAVRYDVNGDGTVDDRWIASWRTYYVAFPEGAANMGCPDGCTGYELTEDLDFDTNGTGVADAGDDYWNNGAGWSPIGTLSGPFTATVEGNGHVLTNLFIRRSSGFVGLFGLGHGPRIRNVGVVDIDIAVAVRGAQSTQVGGLIGGTDQSSSITTCYATGLIAITGSGTSVVDPSSVYAGGLAGVNTGQIALSHAQVDVTATVGDRQTNVGGLVGYNGFLYGRITTSHASGRVEANGADTVAGGLVGLNYLTARVVSSYATGPVTATGVAGGLVGDNPNSWTVASYASGPVTATGASGIAGGLIGRAGSNRFFSPSRIAAVYATGRVTATGESGIAGGLVGVVKDASGGSVGDALSSLVTTVYATGRVTATGSSGSAAGLVAVQEGAVRISVGYWDTRTSATTSGLGEGRTTRELQAPTGYAGPYVHWNLDTAVYDVAENPWRFGTEAQYPALAVDVDDDGTATWQEFGHQLRAGPTLRATGTAGTAVKLDWTPVDASDWTLAREVTYTVTRDDGVAVSVLAEGLAGLAATDSDVVRGTPYRYQVSAGVDGTEAVRSAVVVVNNWAPTPVGSIANRNLRPGVADVVDVSGAFQDLDNDTLTYFASSSAPAVASARASGSQVTLTPGTVGSATITVTATDVAGTNSPAAQQFLATVARPGVTVSHDAVTIREGSTKTYSVVLDAEPTGSVTVTPTVPAQTDVSVDPTELEFTTGDWQIPQTVFVEAETDADAAAEAPVTISHHVSGADYGSVRASSVRVTILETDTSTLSVEAREASEGGGSIVFRVLLTKANSSDVTVDYATSNGSALEGSDYTMANGTLTFPASLTASQQIVVDITNDTEDEEEEESFRLTLSNAQHASLAGGGSTLQVTGTIRDDDDPEVEVSFGSANYGVTEGRTVNVVVRLDRDPERDLDIFLDTDHHGGTTGADYSGVPPSVTFGPGVRTQEFLFAATDDSEDDDGEAVMLSFGFLPSRVSGDGETTVAIQDNDGRRSPGSPGGPGGPGGPEGGGPPPLDDDEEDDDSGGGGGGGPPPPSGPPMADFMLAAECAEDLCRARTGVPVTFEDTSTGRVVTRLWDFGDGTTSRNRRVAHTWKSPGFYGVTLSVSDGTTTSVASEVFRVETSEPAGTCETDAQTLCLQDSRYAVAVDWWTAAGASGAASVVHSGTNDSGLFWFFDPNNWEVLIKVLDGCALNGHVWVFGASTTDLGYVIRVTDTVTGTVKEYRNEPGLPAPAMTDATALPEGCRP